MSRYNPFCNLVFGALLLMLGAGCAVDAETREATFDRTLTVGGPVDLDVRTGSGSIQIRSGPGGTLRVFGHVRGSELWTRQDVADRVRQIAGNPPIQQDGNTIRIGNLPNDLLFRNISISYEIMTPFETRVRSRSGSGTQTLGDLRGPVDASTGSGDVRLGHIADDVQASTGSGAISLQGAHSTVRARAGSGNIDVAGSPGEEWNLRTGSGDITLRLDSNASFNLNARTASGVIDAPPLTLSGTSVRQVLGTVGGGGANVDVATASGSITIH